MRSWTLIIADEHIRAPLYELPCAAAVYCAVAQSMHATVVDEDGRCPVQGGPVVTVAAATCVHAVIADAKCRSAVDEDVRRACC